MSKSIFSSIEGRFLAIGLTLTALMFLAFGIAGHLYPEKILPYAVIMLMGVASKHLTLSEV